MQDVVEKESANSSMINSMQMVLKSKRRDKDSLIRDCINALALCHNVTPVVDAVT